MKIGERSQRKLTASTCPLSTTRDQKVNLSYIKRLECEFLCCYRLMLRLHRVVVYKVTLGFTYGGNIGSF